MNINSKVAIRYLKNCIWTLPFPKWQTVSDNTVFWWWLEKSWLHHSLSVSTWPVLECGHNFNQKTQGDIDIFHTHFDFFCLRHNRFYFFLLVRSRWKKSAKIQISLRSNRAEKKHSVLHGSALDVITVLQLNHKAGAGHPGAIWKIGKRVDMDGIHSFYLLWTSAQTLPFQTAL